MTHDYTRKRGVVHTEILLPPHAPPSFSDRATLWNSVELYEKAGNAQLAREIDAALPIELSREEQIRLVRELQRRAEITDGKYLREAVYGLKEPPQEETVEIIRMSEVDTQTVEWPVSYTHLREELKKSGYQI